jgi:hypothetical protein
VNIIQRSIQSDKRENFSFFPNCLQHRDNPTEMVPSYGCSIVIKIMNDLFGVQILTNINQFKTLFETILKLIFLICQLMMILMLMSLMISVLICLQN